MPAPPLVEPPACNSIDGRHDLGLVEARGRRQDQSRGARVDDDGDTVVLAELFDQSLQAPTGPGEACWARSIEPETSTRKTRLLAGRRDWSMGLAAMPIRASRCWAFQGQPATSV